MEGERASTWREIVWAIERVGFPIFVSTLCTVGLAFTLHLQFEFFREQIRDTTTVLRNMQAEQVKQNLIQEKLLIRVEALTLKSAP